MLALSACGGGGGGGGSGNPGGGNPGGGNPSALTKTYLVAQTFLPGSPNTRSGISLVDPDNPTVEVVIEPASSNVVDTAMVTTGKWDTTNRRVTDLHRSHFVYLKDGKIYKLDLRKGASAPAPVQVSNETAACGDLESSTTFGDPNVARVRYRGGDTSGSCVAPVPKLINLASPAAESPRLGATDVIDVTGSFDANGVQNGWIGYTQAGVLNFYDVDFGSSTILADAAVFDSRGVTTADGHVLKIDGSLHLYRFSNSTLDTTPLFSAPAGEGIASWELDGTDLFVLTGPSGPPVSPTAVWKVPVAGGGATSLASLSNVSTNFQVTTNKLIFRDSTGLFSIAKSDGARNSVASGAINSTILTKADKVLFEITPVVNNSVGTTRPRVIDETGTIVKDFEGFRLFDQTAATSVTFDSSEIPISKVILVNATNVTSLDLATMGELVLGTLPTQTSDSFRGLANGNFRYGDLGVGFATSGTGPAQKVDLYYADANAAGSLRRLTNNIP